MYPKHLWSFDFTRRSKQASRPCHPSSFPERFFLATWLPGILKGSCIFCSSYCPLPFTSLNLRLHNQLGLSLLVWVLPHNSQSMHKIEDRTQACMQTESRDARNGPYFMASPWEQRKEGATVVSATWVWPVLIGTWLGFEMVYAGLTPRALLYFWNMYSTRDLFQTFSNCFNLWHPVFPFFWFVCPARPSDQSISHISPSNLQGLSGSLVPGFPPRFPWVRRNNSESMKIA